MPDFELHQEQNYQSILSYLLAHLLAQCWPHFQKMHPNVVAVGRLQMYKS